LFRLSGVEAQVNGIINLFHPIDSWTINLEFTNGVENKMTNNINITWYQMWKAYIGNAMDWKYCLVIIRSFNMDLGVNGTRFWSAQLDYPFGVSGNNWRTGKVLINPMNTKQGEYDFEMNWDPPKWRISAKFFNTDNYGQFINHSFWFIVAII
jgi:hypothetical protein